MINLDHNHDWIEPTRATLYPKLHPYLKTVGGYGVGTVKENQYAATIPAGEETLEKVLADRGWERNPIAAYKTHEDGRQSEGSWRLRGHNLIEDGDKQLHVTFLNNQDVEEYVDMYAHLEYDWERAPMKHLREVEFDAVEGSSLARAFVRDHTYLDWYHKEDDLNEGREGENN